MSPVYQCGKVTYKTVQHAWREARVIAKRRKKECGHDRGPLRPYKCPTCKDWHLTSAEEYKKRDRKGKHEKQVKKKIKIRTCIINRKRLRL